MCWFKRKKIHALDIDSIDTDAFNKILISEINKLRETPLKLIKNKLITFLANAHDTKQHDNYSIRVQLIKDNTRFKGVGENVAYGYEDAVKLVNAWKNSHAHKEIMTGNYTHLVIGKNNRVLTGLFLRV